MGLLTKRLKNAKSELFEQHKNIMDGLQDGYLKTKQDIIDGHEKSIEEIENKLEDLRVDKNIHEDQIRNLEEACNKQKNDEHMKLLERIKRRKKQLQQHEDELNKKAQSENWSNDKLNNEIKALRDAYQNEVKGVLNAANTRHNAAHDRLMKRLMKVKGEEAKNISALEAANQASPEQIAAIHAKADDEVIDILKESGMDSDVVTAGVLHSMYDLKL